MDREQASERSIHASLCAYERYHVCVWVGVCAYVCLCVQVCLVRVCEVCDACVYCSAMRFFSIASKEIAPPPLKFESGTSSSDSVRGATSF